MTGFTDFVTVELPKRPFTEDDGAPGQTLVRSSNLAATRQLVWADLPTGATTYTAATAISGHMLVTLNSTGEAIYADCTSVSKVNVLGITTGAASAGAEVSLATQGTLEFNGWTFTVDQLVFLGLNGTLTQILPPGAICQKVVGLAISATCVSIELRPPIYF